MFFSPVVDDIGHDGDQQAEQHDCSAGVHHRVQVVPGVRGEGQHPLQILQRDTGQRTQQMNRIYREIHALA